MTGVTYVKQQADDDRYRIVLTLIDAHLHTATLVRDCGGEAVSVAHAPGNLSEVVWPEVAAGPDGAVAMTLTWTVISNAPGTPYEARIRIYDAAGRLAATHPGSSNPLRMSGVTGAQSADHGIATASIV